MKAVIFDLDGTLVQTEILKAKSYARAAASLCPGFLEEREVVEAFKEVVGLSRHEVAKALLLRFDLEEQFDFVATRDDVTFGKPDPEIYTLVARELDVPAEQCLVIEDSLNGVKAALAAGMSCLAVTTDFTSTQVHAGGLLDPRWIVDEPNTLQAVAEDFITEHDFEPKTMT